MQHVFSQAQSFDSFELTSAENGRSRGNGAESPAFNEAEESEWATELLALTGEDELDQFLGELIGRTARITTSQAALSDLRSILRRSARAAFPNIRGSKEYAARSSDASVAEMSGAILGLELDEVNLEEEEQEVASRFVRFARTSAENLPHFLASAPSEIAARRAVGAAVLEEIYESSGPIGESLLLEYPFLYAEDEELDYFFGKIFRKVAKAVGGVAKAVGSAAKTVGKGISAVSKVVPVSLITQGLSFTPIGLAARAGLGAMQAVAEGKNPFQAAVRSLAASPATRFLIDTGAAVAGGENVLKAAQKAFKAGVGDLKQSLQLATMVAPFIPGIGTGVAAALGAATALANGEPITDALIAGARSAIPGGAVAQMAFDTALNLARGKNIGESLLQSARARLPGGPGAQAAFDAAITLAKGKSLQDAAFAATGRLLPRSPYASGALDFIKKVTSGQNIQQAALSSLGTQVLGRIERQAGPLFTHLQTRIPRIPSNPITRPIQSAQAVRAAALARARNRIRQPLRRELEVDFAQPALEGRWYRTGGLIIVAGV